MSANNGFTAALEMVLKYEGGLVDHPDDPGGVTFRGISLRFLRVLHLDPNNDGVIDRRDIIGLSDGQISVLYRERFWDAGRLGEMPAPIALVVFDCAVNQGLGTAVKLLQKSGGVVVDGKSGPVTIAAINAKSGRSRVLRDFMARRALRYAINLKVLIFGLGWFRRLMDIHAKALVIQCKAGQTI